MAEDKFRRTDADQELASLSCPEIAAPDIPDRLLIAPWGNVESTNGDFIVDEEAAALVVAAFDAHGTDVPIDYEHQTLGGAYRSPTGQAPAAGWITRIAAEPGVGLTATVTWTEQAKSQLTARQYRYLSPVVLVRKGDRRIVALHSAALTNKPAIVGMQAIVNRSSGAPAAEEVHPLIALRARLALDEEFSDEDVVSAAERVIGELQACARRRQASQRIAEAARLGRLTGAQRPWAMRLALTDEDLFEEWMSTAPIVVTPGRTSAPRSAPSRGKSAAAAARREFRAAPFLAQLTSEEAFVADAVRHG